MNEQNVRVGATLAIRSREDRTYSISVGRKVPNLYRVAAIAVPDLPDLNEKSLPFVVCCLQYARWDHSAKPSWGWVHLDYDTKQLIAEDLAALNVGINEWRYMVIGIPDPVSLEITE